MGITVVPIINLGKCSRSWSHIGTGHFHYFYILQYHCYKYTNAKYKYKNTNTQTYKCKHTKANAPLKYISTNIQNKSTTYSMVKFKSTTSVTYIAIQFVFIHYFSKIECNTLPQQYDYNTIQCTAKSTTIQAELKLLRQELYGHWSYS